MAKRLLLYDLNTSRTPLRHEQATFLARLIRELARVARNTSEGKVGGTPEYTRFIEGTHACNFVCRDIDGAKFSDWAEDLTRNPEKLRRLDLKGLRTYLHTLVRGERAVDWGYIYPALRGGALEIVADRLADDLSLREEITGPK